MSALAGVIGYDADLDAYPLGHILMRGLEKFPADDVQTWQDRSLFLGCHAQWITPESVNEPMPRYEEGDQLLLAADAILDNREELFDRLHIAVSERSSMTDSALILHAYRQWGAASPKYLAGDFAYVIWDQRQRLLFGARDLFGNRTLYYHQHDDYFAFCSTISPLLALPGARKKLHEPWLADYLAIPDMYDSFDLAATAYAGIRQLPPGCTFTLQGRKFSHQSYGSIIPEQELSFKSDGEYEEAFRNILDLAVRARLRSRHRIAATLSGGLDSGTVASFAAKALREQRKPLYTYSSVPVEDFQDWTGRSMLANESPYIASTVAFLGNIESKLMDFAGLNSLTEVDDWLDILETPYKYVENSFWIRGVYEQAARDGAGILLTGAKGNHSISWGPAIGYYAYMLRNWKVKGLYEELRSYSRIRGIGRRRLLSLIAKRAYGAGAFGLRSRKPTLSELIAPAFAQDMRMTERLMPHKLNLNGAYLSNAMDARIRHFENGAIANTFGSKAMKLSLRYKVWERDPTSDIRVVRFCLSVPVEQYVRNGQDRALVRRSMQGLLPDDIRLNHKVRGIQGADWVHRLRHQWAELTEEVLAMCKQPAIAHYLNAARIRQACNRVGQAPNADQAFNGETRLIMQSLVTGRFIQQFHA